MFDPARWLASTAGMPAEVRAVAEALAQEADASGEFTASSGTLRAIGARVKVRGVRLDNALKRLRQERLLVVVERGVPELHQLTRWALVYNASTVTTSRIAAPLAPRGTHHAQR